MYGLKLGSRQGLGEKPYVEIELAGVSDDVNSGHGEPNERLFDLNPGYIVDLAGTELPGDGLIVVDEVGELNVAGGGEVDGEGAVVGDIVGFDDVG